MKHNNNNSTYNYNNNNNTSHTSIFYSAYNKHFWNSRNWRYHVNVYVVDFDADVDVEAKYCSRRLSVCASR